MSIIIEYAAGRMRRYQFRASPDWILILPTCKAISLAEEPLPGATQVCALANLESAADSAAHPRRRDQAGVPLEPAHDQQTAAWQIRNGREGYLQQLQHTKVKTRGRRKITANQVCDFQCAGHLRGSSRTFRPRPLHQLLSPPPPCSGSGWVRICVFHSAATCSRRRYPATDRHAVRDRFADQKVTSRSTGAQKLVMDRADGALPTKALADAGQRDDHSAAVQRHPWPFWAGAAPFRADAASPGSGDDRARARTNSGDRPQHTPSAGSAPAHQAGRLSD